MKGIPAFAGVFFFFKKEVLEFITAPKSEGNSIVKHSSRCARYSQFILQRTTSKEAGEVSIPIGIGTKKENDASIGELSPIGDHSAIKIIYSRSIYRDIPRDPH